MTEAEAVKTAIEYPAIIDNLGWAIFILAEVTIIIGVLFVIVWGLYHVCEFIRECIDDIRAHFRAKRLCDDYERHRRGNDE